MAHHLADKSWKLHDYEAGCNINRKALNDIYGIYIYQYYIIWPIHYFDVNKLYQIIGFRSFVWIECFVSSVSIIRVLNGLQ